MKWNKKICVQYLMEMRSPIEEQTNPNQGRFSQAIEAIRQTVKQTPEETR